MQAGQDCRVGSVDRNVKLRELLVGVEGLALLRHLYDGSSTDAEKRIAEVHRLLKDDAFSAGERMREEDPRTGYRAWSDHYDEPGNPVIAMEEPAVWSLLDSIAAGACLDAACGTGRHARHLVDGGHTVVGVDVTPEMLSRARENVPEGTFLEADLQAIPADEERFDAVVCGLALAHLADLAAGVAELGRVLRSQGRMGISVLHPFQAHLGWHAPFEDAKNGRGFVREHPPHARRLFLAVRWGGSEGSRLSGTDTGAGPSPSQAARFSTHPRGHGRCVSRSSWRLDLGPGEGVDPAHATARAPGFHVRWRIPRRDGSTPGEPLQQGSPRTDAAGGWVA